MTNPPVINNDNTMLKLHQEIQAELDMAKFFCEECGEKSHGSSTKIMSHNIIETYYRCQNEDCGQTMVVQSTVARITTPSRLKVVNVAEQLLASMNKNERQAILAKFH